MIYISKISNEDYGVESLPLPEETPFWKDADLSAMTKRELRDYYVYSAIRDVENYFQFNSPTAFGNPDYARKCGFMDGLFKAYGLDRQVINDRIVIKMRNGVNLMIVERPCKSEAYLKEKQEIQNAMERFRR